jgi:hypothetical protein
MAESSYFFDAAEHFQFRGSDSPRLVAAGLIFAKFTLKDTAMDSTHVEMQLTQADMNFTAAVTESRKRKPDLGWMIMPLALGLKNTSVLVGALYEEIQELKAKAGLKKGEVHYGPRE